MARLSLMLLGGFQARLDPGPALALPTRKAQALLAYLALPLGGAHPRDKLAALLWGGIREESARASLRQALFAIRKALGEAAQQKPADALAMTVGGHIEAIDLGGISVDLALDDRLGGRQEARAQWQLGDALIEEMAYGWPEIDTLIQACSEKAKTE